MAKVLTPSLFEVLLSQLVLVSNSTWTHVAKVGNVKPQIGEFKRIETNTAQMAGATSSIVKSLGLS
jgi:hypothetical protein